MVALEAHGGRRTDGLGEGRLEFHAALFAGHACGDRGLDRDPSGLGPELIPRHHAVASRMAADPALGEGQDHGLAVVTVRHRRALPVDELPTVRLEPTARLGGRQCDRRSGGDGGGSGGRPTALRGATDERDDQRGKSGQHAHGNLICSSKDSISVGLKAERT